MYITVLDFREGTVHQYQMQPVEMQLILLVSHQVGLLTQLTLLLMDLIT